MSWWDINEKVKRARNLVDSQEVLFDEDFFSMSCLAQLKSHSFPMQCARIDLLYDRKKTMKKKDLMKLKRTYIILLFFDFVLFSHFISLVVLLVKIEVNLKINFLGIVTSLVLGKNKFTTRLSKRK
jgi:hypothetical protein